MAQVQVKFQRNRETPGTFLYKEIDKPNELTPAQFQKVGALYLKKRLFNGGAAPEFVTVTVDLG